MGFDIVADVDGTSACDAIGYVNPVKKTLTVASWICDSRRVAEYGKEGGWSSAILSGLILCDAQLVLRHLSSSRLYISNGYRIKKHPRYGAHSSD